MDYFQSGVLLNTTDSRIWLLTSFILLDRLCCTIIIGFTAIIITYRTSLGSQICYLYQEGVWWLIRSNGMGCSYRGIKLAFLLNTSNWIHIYFSVWISVISNIFQRDSFSGLLAFLPSLLRLPRVIYQTGYIYIFFVRFPLPLRSTGSKRNNVTLLIFLLLPQLRFLEDCCMQIPHLWGHFFSVWIEHNDLEHPLTEKVMRYHIQSRS